MRIFSSQVQILIHFTPMILIKSSLSVLASHFSWVWWLISRMKSSLSCFIWMMLTFDAHVLIMVVFVNSRLTRRDLWQKWKLAVVRETWWNLCSSIRTDELRRDSSDGWFWALKTRDGRHQRKFRNKFSQCVRCYEPRLQAGQSWHGMTRNTLLS